MRANIFKYSSNFSLSVVKPYHLSSLLLGFCGLALVGLGLYFIVLRPPLLPEDLRYMGVSDTFAMENMPKLAQWLQKVFWVTGGYITTTGIAVLGTAFKGFPQDRTTIITMAIMGGASIGWMTYVNFLLQSDFRWLLLSLSVIWAVAIVSGLIQQKKN